MSDRLKQLGVEIPAEERTPLVNQLVGVVEMLLDEIDRLKGLPQLPKRPVISPSSLEDDSGPPSQQDKPTKRKKPKRPKGHKRNKNANLQINDTITLQPEVIPQGAVPAGAKSFVVQELRLEPVCIRYRRQRYRLPDGTLIQAERPEHLKSQFGPNLRCFILYQYFHNQVTEPCLLKQLSDVGISISSGQISRIITEGHEKFHAEKESLLEAGRAVSKYFQADDTSARIQGSNGHTLHVGNDLFAYFETTHSKSRLNFLEIIRRPHIDYVFGPDAQEYLQWHRFPEKVLASIQAQLTDRCIWPSLRSWERQLDAWGVADADLRHQLTEAAAWGSLMYHDLYVDQPFLTDGAKQFKLLCFDHGLCWLHAERGVARLVPTNRRQQVAQAKIRDEIWNLYQSLKGYKAQPDPAVAQTLRQRFDELFLRSTGWPELNDRLRKIHARRDELLLVLEHPELPLHNNLSENDIRQFAKLRKISGSSRSEAGRRCRDTFLSLKTTCRKLKLSFWKFLQDRIFGIGQIEPLGEIIIAHSTSE